MGSLSDSELNKYASNDDSKSKEVDSNMDVGLIQRKEIGAVIIPKQPEKIPKLFTPFTIRGQTFSNRILVSTKKTNFGVVSLMEDSHIS